MEKKEVIWEGEMECSRGEVHKYYEILGEVFVKEYINRMMNLIGGTIVETLKEVVEHEGDEEWINKRKECMMKALEMLRENVK